MDLKKNFVKIACLYLLFVNSQLFAQTFTSDVEKTVVKIRGSKVKKIGLPGTGFVFYAAQRAYIMTANHVVTDSDGFPLTTIIVQFQGYDKPYYSKIAFQYEDIDVAVLTLDEFPKNTKMLKLGNSTTVKVGEEVFIFGYPGGAKARQRNGYASGKDKNRIFLDKIIIEEGNSGSPLLRRTRTEVIGIIIQEATGDVDEYALDINSVKLRLEKEPTFRSLFISDVDVKMKSPVGVGVLAFFLPLAGHIQVGRPHNIFRGILYQGAGTTLIVLGVLWNLGDDGIFPFLAGLGINFASALDAGFSMNSVNDKKRYQEGLSFNISRNIIESSYSFTVAYSF